MPIDRPVSSSLHSKYIHKLLMLLQAKVPYAEPLSVTCMVPSVQLEKRLANSSHLGDPSNQYITITPSSTPRPAPRAYCPILRERADFVEIGSFQTWEHDNQANGTVSEAAKEAKLANHLKHLPQASNKLMKANEVIWYDPPWLSLISTSVNPWAGFVACALRNVAQQIDIVREMQSTTTATTRLCQWLFRGQHRWLSLTPNSDLTRQLSSTASECIVEIVWVIFGQLPILFGGG